MKQLKTILISLMLMFAYTSSHAAELKKIEEDMPSPALKLDSINGKAFDLADFKNQIVLVQFWATYCTPCRMEMPSMNKLMAKLKEANVPFEILAVNMGETEDEVKKFIEEVKPEFTILKGQGENMQAWNVFAAPSNFIIGPKGKIRYTLYGGVEWDSEEITKAITELATEISKDDTKTDKPKAEDTKDKTEADKAKTNETEDKSEAEKTETTETKKD